MSSSPQTNALSRKEREKLARQEEIVKAARELFARKGYHETTLEEIARQAEFGKGTIYNYFTSKDELFQGIMRTLLEEVRSIALGALNVTTTDIRAKLAAYAKAVLSFSAANSDLFHVVMREFVLGDAAEMKKRMERLEEHTRETWQLLAASLEQGMRSGQIRRGDALELATVFDGMLRFYGMHYLIARRLTEKEEIDKAAEQMVSIFFDGIAERTGKE